MDIDDAGSGSKDRNVKRSLVLHDSIQGEENTHPESGAIVIREQQAKVVLGGAPQTLPHSRSNSDSKRLKICEKYVDATPSNTSVASFEEDHREQ